MANIKHIMVFDEAAWRLNNFGNVKSLIFDQQRHLQQLHVSKDMPTRHHYYDEILQAFSRNKPCWDAFLKCLYTYAAVWAINVLS